MPTSEILGLASLVFWLAITLDRSRSWPRELRLPESASPVADWPPSEVVALVPARDEAAILPRTLPTILAQGVTTVLIDDGSSDGTAEVAREAARVHGFEGRLHVVAAPTVRAAWSGKVRALAHGLEMVESELAYRPQWLLLTDADIAHPPGSVAALLARARAGEPGYDLVSIMARLHATTLWERLLIPPFVFFFQLLYPFRRVSRPRSKLAAAAGGCILLRREALRASGGFEAISRAVIDDVALAALIRRAGGRLWLGLHPEIRSLRRYDRLGAIWGMVSRTAFVQLRHSVLALVSTLAALAVFVAAPPFIVLWAGAQTLTGGGAARAAAWALVAWSLQAIALAPVVRHHRVRMAWSATLPFAAILYGLMTWSSAWRHWLGTGVSWKGRHYGSSRRTGDDT